MKPMAKRLVSLSLAACLLGSAAVLPASAAPWDSSSGGVLETLLEVPILGDLLRLFTGDEAESNGKETDSVALAASTLEDATPETGTPESATQESATPETAIDWPDSWMVGSVAPGGRYPAGDPEAARTLTVPSALWSTVELETGTLDAACREETNFGDLAADAISYAVAASSAWQQDPLPLVSVLDGRRLLKTIPAETVLDEDTLAEYLTDDDIALVVVTPRQLQQILTGAMQDMLDSTSEEYGSFLQVSGMRFTYLTTDGNLRLNQLWLASPDGEVALDLEDDSTRIALAMPKTLYESSVPETENLLADAGLTLQGALLDLPKNCDADTLNIMLQRGGTSGRILPDGAQTYTAYLTTDGSITNAFATVYVDGTTVKATLDQDGTLVIPDLAPGGHTILLQPGGTGYYVSNLLNVGTDSGVKPVVTLPEGFVTTPQATPTPEKTPSPTAKPTPTPTQTPQTITVTATATPSPTPVPAPAAPAPVSTPTAHATARPSSGSGVKDPTAGTIIGVTPAPTLEPTPTPAPTPTATPDPEEEQQAQQIQETSSMLPLYVGIGLLVVCAVIVAVVVIRRRLEEDQGSHYHKH